MQRWEYQIWPAPGYLYRASDVYTEEQIQKNRITAANKVQELGEEGWEMVNVFTATEVPGERELIVYYLKRPIEE